MEELLKTIYEFVINSVNSSSFLGPVFACFLIFIESIIPVLPLFVFITETPPHGLRRCRVRKRLTL